MDTLAVDIWSDIACPWCYVGKRRLEAALARFAHRDAVAITWRSFELDPDAPRRQDEGPYAARLAAKYGTSVARAEQMIQQMTETAAGDGLALRFDRVRPGNTFDAHRLLHLAGRRGLGGALKERFLRGYLGEGQPIGDPEALVAMASEVGLDAAEVRAALVGGAHAAEVRADEMTARQLGIRGVPFFVFDRRNAVSGAQRAETLLRALEQTWAERAARASDDAPVCGPDGCA